MSDLDDRQLDRAIRGLVSRAAADAPPAPTIDARSARPVRLGPPADSDRRRWVVTGIAGLSIAAAVVGLVVVNRPQSAEPPAPVATQPAGPVTTPATSPATAVLPAPATTFADVATTEPVLTEPPAVGTAPPTTNPEVTGAEFGDELASILTAGPGGVTVQPIEQEPVSVTAQPARIAIRTADGVTWLQTYDPEVADAAEPLMQVRSGQSVAEAVALPGEITGPIVLHDAATIASESVLLLEERPPTCASGDGCDGTLWAFRPGRGTVDLVTTMNVWEGGWSRLALTTNGIVVGEASDGPNVSPFSTVIPGADVAPVDFTSVGLEAMYTDCDCPSSFTIDSTGRYLAWIAPDPGNGRAVFVARLSDGLTSELPLGSVLPAFASIDIGNLAIDGAGIWGGTVLVNDRDPAGRPPVAAQLPLRGEPTSADGPGTMSFGA